MFKKLAPDHQPVWNLERTINELKDNFIEMKFNDPDFRNSMLIRLKVLNSLQEKKLIDQNLEWIRYRFLYFLNLYLNLLLYDIYRNQA